MHAYDFVPGLVSGEKTRKKEPKFPGARRAVTAMGRGGRLNTFEQRSLKNPLKTGGYNF